MNPLRKLLIKSLHRAQVCPTARTPRADVLAAIRKLRPRLADQPLIRLGPSGDGGYLVPDDLGGIGACYSPGVDRVSDFELACAERGMEVFMADASVEGPATFHPRFHFQKKFLGATNDSLYMTLDEWVATTRPGTSDDLLLQIDIEGFEYETLLATSESLLRRFRIIVAEFHKLDQFWNRPFFGLAWRAYEKLLQTHACVHIHPNNAGPTVTHDGIGLPYFCEFTFVRRDRLTTERFATQFPHPLDRPNVERPDVPLGRAWYCD